MRFLVTMFLQQSTDFTKTNLIYLHTNCVPLFHLRNSQSIGNYGILCRICCMCFLLLHIVSVCLFIISGYYIPMVRLAFIYYLCIKSFAITIFVSFVFKQTSAPLINPLIIIFSTIFALWIQMIFKGTSCHINYKTNCNFIVQVDVKFYVYLIQLYLNVINNLC